MGDRMVVVGPVNGLLKAFRKGITLTKRIATVARNVSPATGPHALELARSLGKSLVKSETQIDSAYSQGITALGKQFADALINDQVAVNKFQGMTINLLDQFMSLGDYMDEPEAFNVLSLQDIQQESEQACEQTVEILNAVHQQLFAAVFQNFKLSGQDSSERTSRPISEVSPTHSTPSAGFSSYIPNSRSVGRSATRTVPDSLDSRIAGHKQLGSGATNDPLQRPANDDRGQLPSQRGIPTARPDSQFSSTGVSSQSDAPSYTHSGMFFSKMASVRYSTSNASARPPPRPSSNQWDDPPEAYKPIASPMTADERQGAQPAAPLQQAALNRIASNNPTQNIDPHSQTRSPNTSVSNPQDSFAARAAASEPRGMRISHPSHFQINIPTGTSYGNYEGEIQPRTTNIVNNPSPKLIDSESVMRQVTSNENFLEKRRASKTSFRNNMDNLWQSTNSPFSSSSNPSYPASPALLATPEFSLSALPVSQSDSTLLMTRSISREGLYHVNSKTPSPRNSATLLERPTSVAEMDESEQSHTRGSSAGFEGPRSMLGNLGSERSSSIASEPMVSRPLESPHLALGSGRQSAEEDLEFLGGIVKVPGSAEGFDNGKEVVGILVSDSGLMLANEDGINNKPAPTLSPQLVDYPLRHNSSFLFYGGFCESAKKLVRGDESALKVVKKPGGGGVLYISKKCVNCAYEMDFNVWERDQARDPAGIYRTTAINFRQKFLSKCHVATKHTDAPAYACIFCIEEEKTVEEYDATIFFSVNSLFRHLRKHTRPLKQVEGVIVVYGDDPTTADFDIHFKTMDPSPSPFGAISSKISSRPKALAVVNHYPKAKGFRDVDPNKVATLQFARGARIVGITYPARLNGAWCCGYHDEEKAYFPASAIVLEPPPAEDCTAHANSALCAIAKWDHKPKDTSAGWLTFSKKEKITNIGFKYQEAWCWTGQNSKGRWGFFPACFVDSVSEGVGGLSPRIGALSRQIPGEMTKNHSGASFSLSRLSTHAFHRRSATSDSRSSGGASSQVPSPT